MICAVCVIGLGVIAPVLTESHYGQPSAVLWKDQLFVAVNGGARLYTVGHLSRGTFAPEKKGIRPQILYYTPTASEPWSSQAKLDLSDGRLLAFHAGVAHVIVPLADLQLLERNEWGQERCRERGYQHYSDVVRQFSGGGHFMFFPPHLDREPDVPLPKRGGFGDGISEKPEYAYTYKARYDVQIWGPQTVRLFHAHENKLFVSIEPDYLHNWFSKEFPSQVKQKTTPEERRLRTGKLPASFTERFAAYSAEDRDYLVTTNGKAYLSVPKGKTEVDVSAVWTDPKRRIVGVVKDATNDAVYGWGFTTTWLSPERFYVKLGSKPEAKRYARTTLLQIDRFDADIESYECACAFRLALEKK